MKILVAEDDVTSRFMIQSFLDKWGYEVICASDGEEAWAVLQVTEAPQLAILDWMMPSIDGLSLCKRLRGQKRQAPLYIILLTTKGDRHDIIEGLEAGADDYVTKPFDPEELRARLNVGQRVVGLQNDLNDSEKFKGVVEMAGAVCHELNQPLQGLLGFSEMLLMDLTPEDPSYETAKAIIKEVERIGVLTHRFMTITKYRTKAYMNGRRVIVDIEKASSPDE
jgi:sigma-B regulation protein RsbU (phosphoserine phosphatase)